MHISKCYYPFRGGTERIAQDCVKALVCTYEQKVICFNDSIGDKNGEVDGVEVIYCETFATIFSQGLAEGMYYGKPVVTFSIPGSGVNYVCLNVENGIEVSNRNIEKYAEAMKKLADDPKPGQRYGTAGKKCVEENFLNTQFRGNIIDVVKKLWLRVKIWEIE